MRSVLETPIFTRRADADLSADDRMDLIDALSQRPEAGVLVVGLKGVRKMRWAPKGRGKSGAYRVVYYYSDDNHPVLAILLIAKNEQADLTPQQRKAILKLFQST